jgi:heme exporter protein C
VNAFIYLVWKIKLCDILNAASLAVGASFTLLALVTGSIWGKPMWGTFWIWDARLTSELILLFIYFGLIALRQNLQQHPELAKIFSMMALIGGVDLPIIHFSVYWWNTLHQGRTLTFIGPQLIDTSMLIPLLFMMAAFACYSACVILRRTQGIILEREINHQWVKELCQISSK